MEIMLKLYQGVIEGKGIPDKWETSLEVSIYKAKGDDVNCGSYIGITLLKHSSYGRSSSNVDGDVVEPASSLVIRDQQPMISSGGTM